MSVDQIRNLMQKYGKYDLSYKEYQRFKADTKRTANQDKTTEFLHILEKK